MYPWRICKNTVIAVKKSPSFRTFFCLNCKYSPTAAIQLEVRIFKFSFFFSLKGAHCFRRGSASLKSAAICTFKHTRYWFLLCNKTIRFDYDYELKIGDVRCKHLIYKQQLKYNSFDVYHMKCTSSFAKKKAGRLWRRIKNWRRQIKTFDLNNN